MVDVSLGHEHFRTRLKEFYAEMRAKRTGQREELNSHQIWMAGKEWRMKVKRSVKDIKYFPVRECIAFLLWSLPTKENFKMGIKVLKILKPIPLIFLIEREGLDKTIPEVGTCVIKVSAVLYFGSITVFCRIFSFPFYKLGSESTISWQ